MTIQSVFCMRWSVKWIESFCSRDASLFGPKGHWLLRKRFVAFLMERLPQKSRVVKGKNCFLGEFVNHVDKFSRRMSHSDCCAKKYCVKTWLSSFFEYTLIKALWQSALINDLITPCGHYFVHPREGPYSKGPYSGPGYEISEGVARLITHISQTGRIRFSRMDSGDELLAEIPTDYSSRESNSLSLLHPWSVSRPLCAARHSFPCNCSAKQTQPRQLSGSAMVTWQKGEQRM